VVSSVKIHVQELNRDKQIAALVKNEEIFSRMGENISSEAKEVEVKISER
jgi:hypothetical protein